MLLSESSPVLHIIASRGGARGAAQKIASSIPLKPRAG